MPALGELGQDGEWASREGLSDVRNETEKVDYRRGNIGKTEEHEDTHQREQSVVVSTCNPGTWEAETEGW